MDGNDRHSLHAVPRVLFRALGNFRKHDDVLADVYHYLGPSFNFKLVEGCLSLLHRHRRQDVILSAPR